MNEGRKRKSAPSPRKTSTEIAAEAVDDSVDEMKTGSVDETDAHASAWTGNLKLRVLSGVPALALVFTLVGIAPTWIIALVALAAGVYGVYEYHGMLPPERREVLSREPMLLGAALIGLGALTLGLPGLQAAFFLAAVGITIWVWLPAAAGSAEALPTAGSAVFGLVLVPWSISHIPLIHGLPGGPGMLALLVMAVTLNDSVAYLVGSLLGTRPLMPAVSPGKTVEGTLAGLAAGVAGGFLIWIWLLGFTHSPSLLEALILGGVLAALGQTGDLLESKLKRLAGVDDSGSLLPGHGGLLDRMDAFLLTGPALYYYLIITGAFA